MNREQEQSAEVIKQMEKAVLILQNLRNMLDRVAKKTNHVRWQKKVGELDWILDEIESWKDAAVKNMEEEKKAVWEEQKKAKAYRELLGKNLSRSRSFVKSMEERNALCTLRDVFLPLQLLMGNLHTGQDIGMEKEQLTMQLKTMLFEDVPSKEGYIEPSLRLDGWSVEHAKKEMQSLWADMERIQRPVIWNRQLTERILLILLSEELNEKRLRDELDRCGLYARYYEEIEGKYRGNFVLREQGAPYPALFVCSPDEGEWRCQSRGTYIVK